MPYVQEAERVEVGPLVATLATKIHNAGQLAYAIYLLVGQVVQLWGGSFVARAEARGATLEALDEYRRRSTVPYEERKRKENGDVPIFERDEKGNLRLI